jgi:hypothetical protein
VNRRAVVRALTSHRPDRALYRCLSPFAIATVAGSGPAGRETSALVNAASEQTSKAMVISANTKTVKKVLMVLFVAPEYGRISQTGRRKTEVSFRSLPVMRRRACAGALTSHGFQVGGLGLCRGAPQHSVLAPFHPSFMEWSLLILGVVPFGTGPFRPNLILAVAKLGGC